jgi:hypothetical protein
MQLEGQSRPSFKSPRCLTGVAVVSKPEVESEASPSFDALQLSYLSPVLTIDKCNLHELQAASMR